MAYQIEISPTAIQDVDRIFEWIKERSQSLDVAGKWLDDCYKVILTLEEFPDRCPLAPESEQIGIDIRQLLYGKKRSFRILFTIEFQGLPNESLVHIHRVMRSTQQRLRYEEDLYGE